MPKFNRILRKRTFENYANLPYLNASKAVEGLKSAAHLKSALDGEKVYNSKSMELGKVLHAMVEGEKKTIVVEPDFSQADENIDSKGNRSFSKLTKWAKTETARFKADNAGKWIVSADDYFAAESMFSKIKKNKIAWNLIKGSKKEVSIVAEIKGVKCKGRLDGLNIEKNVFWDVKTARSAETKEFGRQGCKLNYPFKMAFYNLILKAIGINVDAAFFIVVENSGIYETNVIEFSTIEIEQFETQVFEILEMFKRCKKNKLWPERYNDFEPFFIPDYFFPESGAFYE